MRAKVGTVGLLAILSVMSLAACTSEQSRYSRNADGGFEGVVTSVGEDTLEMTVGEGRMRVDTWAVCGDSTARFISVGDEIVVFADREPTDYDAWRILTSDGQPACADGETIDEGTDPSEDMGSDADSGTAEQPRYPRNAEGGFEGQVTAVIEDYLDLSVDGRTMRVDTWAVCGDDTARHISVGDTIILFADREVTDYDAWRILTPGGEPACPR